MRTPPSDPDHDRSDEPRDEPRGRDEETVYIDLNGPQPAYEDGWIEDPMGGLANWYAPDGLTHISTREANALLSSPDRHVACSLVGTVRVCTAFLVLDMALNLTALGYPELHLLWETNAWPEPGSPVDRDDVEDFAGQRYATLPGAKAGHAEVVAELARELDVPLADVVHEDLSANPIAQGRRDWNTP